MIWVIANEVEEDGSFPTYRHYKNAFNPGEIDIYCAKQDDDFSFLNKDDIVLMRTRDENINKRVDEAQRLFGFKSTLESQLTNLLTHDKELVKSLLECSGIPHPKSLYLSEVVDGRKYFVKPRFGENSVGVDERSICTSLNEVDIKCRQLKQMGIEPMIEEYVDGNEVTVAVISSLLRFNPEIYPIIVEPKNESNVHTGQTKRTLIFKSMPYESASLRKIAKEVFNIVGAKHMLRIDFRICDNIPYVIDINMIPGLAPNGYMAECLKAHGIDYYTFIKMLVNTAY